MSFILLLNSSQISILKHRKSHNKLYFIIHDLIEIFAKNQFKVKINII